MAVEEKVVKLSDLKVGAYVSKDIVNHLTGKTIISKDMPITEALLKEIKDYYISAARANKEQSDTVTIHSEDGALMQFINTLPERERESFAEFKKQYDITEDKAREYLHGIEEGKPVDPNELFSMTNNLIDTMGLRSNVFSYLNYLKKQSDFSYAHSLNVSMLCNIFGRWLKLNEIDIEAVTSAGMLLDVGISEINPDILTKQGKLTDAEFAEMKMHPTLGYNILKSQPISEDIRLAVLQHHERIDGSGYPKQLSDVHITKYAKIVAICDVYGAMVAERPYRRKICPFEVIREFERHFFGKLDTEYLMIFLRNIAYNYLNCNIELNDGRHGKVVFINSTNYSAPIVQLDSGEFIDLSTKPSLSIVHVH